MKKYALIVAGGSGYRMGAEIPKQFIELGNKPILMHTLEVFRNFDSDIEIILVLPENSIEYWEELCLKFNFDLSHKLVAGGTNRFQSVKNGLAYITTNGLIFIHDGVRPLVSPQTLQRCLETALKTGNAIPVVSVTDSLRKKEGDNSISVDRTLYYSVQTPQTFRSEQIIEAFSQNYSEAFTDDASVAEKAGFKINLVEGNRENIKITTPTDLVFAEAYLKNSLLSG